MENGVVPSPNLNSLLKTSRLKRATAIKMSSHLNFTVTETFKRHVPEGRDDLDMKSQQLFITSHRAQSLAQVVQF